MALRNQPYIPLYVQDYLTDEKLSMCSWATQGVYIKLLCLLHKSEPYGTILLKQNDKQHLDFASNFASKIMKLLPIEKDILIAAITELVNEKCLTIEGDKLFQRRMVRDNEISIIRSETGKKGGLKTQKIAKAKIKAKHENEDENENVIINDNDNKNMIQKKNEKNDFLDQIIQEFVTVHGDYEIISRGKERAAAGKLLGIYKKKYPKADSEQVLGAMRTYFSQCIVIPDDWLRTNMSLSIIVSQFNKINQILKNGNKKMGATTDLQLAEIVAKHFAND